VKKTVDMSESDLGILADFDVPNHECIPHVPVREAIAELCGNSMGKKGGIAGGSKCSKDYKPFFSYRAPYFVSP